MKTYVFKIAALSSLLFWQCSTQNEISTNYYADGIYYDPLYGDLLSIRTPANNDMTPLQDDDDYVSSASSNEQFFSSPNSRTSANMNFGLGFGMGCSPWGMNSMMSMGMGWGMGSPMMMGMNPWMMDPWMMGYSPWMWSPYRMNPWMNPWAMNPWMNPWGMPGMGMNPWMSPYGFDGGLNFNNGRRNPDIIMVGSGARPGRGNTGTPVKGANGEAKRGNSMSNPIERPSSSVVASAPATRGLNESRVRQAQETQNMATQRQRVTDLSSARNTSAARNQQVQNTLYQKASRTEPVSRDARRSVTDSYVSPSNVQRQSTNTNNTRYVAPATRGNNTQGSMSRPNKSTSATNSSTLQRQSQRVIQNSAPVQNKPSYNTNRSYQSKPTPSRSTSPSNSGGSMRSTPSGGWSSPAPSGGASRPSSGGGSRR